jgi:hypothetical protein
MGSDPPIVPDPRRASPGTFDAAERYVADLRKAAEAMGARCAEIDWYDMASGMAAGFALLPPTDGTDPGYTLVAFSKMVLDEMGFWIYITAGVIHEPRGSRADILEACNTWNAEFPDFPAFVHPTTGDILIQERMRSEVALQTPQLLDLWAGYVPNLVGRFRSSLAEAGIHGEAYEWPYACALAATSISGTQRWTWPVGSDTSRPEVSCGQSEPIILTNGLYMNRRPDGTSVLRFYDDGRVISVGTTADAEPEHLAAWFTWEQHDNRGTYTTRGREITFATTSAEGTVDYHGVSRALTELVLGWHSHINGAEGSDVVYTFVELGTSTT